jgi:hypothetical protein
MDFAVPNLCDVDGDTLGDECTMVEAINRDPIVNVRTLVRVVRHTATLPCAVN